MEKWKRIEERSGKKSGTELRRSVMIRLSALILTVAAFAGLYLNVPGVREFVRNAIESAHNPSELKEFVLSCRSAAPLIILMLTLLQGVITILPLCVVMMASAMVMGLFKGVVVSVASQVIAGYLAMRLTRYFGRPVAERIRISKGFVAASDVIERHGRWGVFVARLVPFGSFDLVNFAAGFLNVKDGDFLLGTLFGVIPATGFYGVVGVNLHRIDWTRSHRYYVMTGVVVVIAIVVYLVIKENRAAGSRPDDA